MMWLSCELMSQSEQWRIPGKNCEAGWEQSISAWDHFQGSKVLELEAFWILRCCVALKWPQSLLRLWRSPTTERDLCWYTITVQNVLVRGNAMLNIVWWTISLLFWEKHCVRVALHLAGVFVKGWTSTVASSSVDFAVMVPCCLSSGIHKRMWWGGGYNLCVPHFSYLSTFRVSLSRNGVSPHHT